MNRITSSGSGFIIKEALFIVNDLNQHFHSFCAEEKRRFHGRKN